MAKKVKRQVPKVGTYLGAGAYKSCYALGEDKVALIASYCDYKFLKRDYNFLKDLESLNVPSVKAKMGKVRWHGKNVNAIILPRYDEGGVRAGSLPHLKLNKTHKKQLVSIYKAIKAKGLFMPDMQFLVRRGRKSEIVLADPNGVETNCEPDRNYNLAELRESMKAMKIRFKA